MWMFGICIVNQMFLYQGEKAEVPIFMYLFNNGYLENVNNTIKVAKPFVFCKQKVQKVAAKNTQACS